MSYSDFLKSRTIIQIRLARFVLLTAVFVGSAVFVAPSEASLVMINGNVSTGAQLVFNSDISFNIQRTGLIASLVFDEWTTDDGTQDSVAMSPVFAFSINGGSTMTVSALLSDNSSSTLNDISRNDGFVFIGSGIAVTAGDTFTVTAGTYSFTAEPAFYPLLNDFSFDGSVFLGDGNAVRNSNIVTAVPEPTSLALFGIAMIGLARRRRLK